MGIAANDGGRAIQTHKNIAIKNKAKENRYMRVYGCSVSDFKKVIDLMGSRKVTVTYKEQRQSANYRGVGWEFSFFEWANIWLDSGKWAKRGRHVGEYCMCRNEDIGPYTKDNIYIDTVTNNLLDGLENRGIMLARVK